MIFPKKPQLLYAPMLGTLGGGSMRSFGRGTGGGGSPVFGYAVATSSNGSMGLLKFDPDTMTEVSYASDNAGSSLQNVAIDDTSIYANHGYSSTSIDTWADKTQTYMSNSAKSSYSNSDPSRSAIAVDANYLYFGDNGGYLRRMNKGNGSIVNSLYYNSGEIYGVAIDPQYVFMGGGMNSGNPRTYQRATMGLVGNTNLGNLSTTLSICSDNDYVYISGVFSPHNNRDHFYRCQKMTNGTGLYNVQYFTSTTYGSGGTTTAICVDNTYVYTCGYGTNRVTQWYKSNGQEAASLAIGYTSAKYGSVTTNANMGMTHDDDYLYIASNTSQGQLIIKVQKSNMTVVDDLWHQHATDWDYYSGGRHIALDNQIGGPAFYTDSAVTNYNITDNTSLLYS